MPKHRLFLTTSPLNTVLVSGYAKHTKQSGDRDILILDRLQQKSSIVNQIKKLSRLHQFDEVLDFTLPVEEVATTKPGVVKRLTRFLKKRPVFRQFYDFLFYFRMRRDNTLYKNQLLASELGNIKSQFVELYLQPLLRFNPSLKKIFPDAEIHYFEHGIGDYLDILIEKSGGVFHCVFQEGYKTYLNKRGKTNIELVQSGQYFSQIGVSQTLQHFPELDQLTKYKGELVLLLTQPLEDLGVDTAFWPSFLEKALHQIEKPESKLFLIKVHQRQNKDSVKVMLDYLQGRGCRVELINDPSINNICLEVMYGVIKEQTTHVITPYSSAIFYLPRLYPEAKTSFLYSYDSIKGFDALTPIQYKKRWALLKQLSDSICVGLAREF